MNTYFTFTSVKKFLKKLAAFAPTKLPIGVEAFNSWAADILSTYEFPDNDSTRWALTSMIIHLGPTAAYKPKRFFGLSLYAAAAKQVAGSIFQDIKLRDLAARKAAEAAEVAKKQAEATAAVQPSASNVIPI